jgi:hypothetical protein
MVASEEQGIEIRREVGIECDSILSCQTLAALCAGQQLTLASCALERLLSVAFSPGGRDDIKLFVHTKFPALPEDFRRWVLGAL